MWKNTDLWETSPHGSGKKRWKEFKEEQGGEN